MRRVFKKEKKYTFVSVQDKTCVFREQSSVDSFYKIGGVSSDDGKKCTFSVDPIYIIFNEQRLKSLGADTAMEYIESLTSNFKSSPLAELRAQCSDEDLMNTIKSRHLQSPSEILDWSRYMSRNMDKFKAVVDEAKAKFNQSNEVKQETSE